MTVLNIESKIRTGSFHAHIKGEKTLAITRGCLFVATEGEGAWIFDAIMRAQTHSQVKFEPFQIWKLHKIHENGYRLRLYSEESIYLERDYLFEMIVEEVDFILSNLTFYFTRGVCMLECEYIYE